MSKVKFVYLDHKEELYINDTLIMSHDRLYVNEVLQALETAGIINYEFKE